MVDASDHDSLDNARTELHELLSKPSLSGAPAVQMQGSILVACMTQSHPLVLDGLTGHASLLPAARGGADACGCDPAYLVRPPCMVVQDAHLWHAATAQASPCWCWATKTTCQARWARRTLSIAWTSRHAP